MHVQRCETCFFPPTTYSPTAESLRWLQSESERHPQASRHAQYAVLRCTREEWVHTERNVKGREMKQRRLGAACEPLRLSWGLRPQVRHNDSLVLDTAN